MDNIQMRFGKEGKKLLGTYIAAMLEADPTLTPRRISDILFLVEEENVKTCSEPFIGLPFQLWKDGPVQVDVYMDLSGETVLTDGIVVRRRGMFRRGDLAVSDKERAQVYPGEVRILQDAVRKYGALSDTEMHEILCGESSLWRKCAAQEGILQSFEENKIVTSTAYVDFAALLDDEDDIDCYLIGLGHAYEIMSDELEVLENIK